MYFFFFQAEDGIRDHCVTGVQTCALPICRDAIGEIAAFAQSLAGISENRLRAVCQRRMSNRNCFRRRTHRMTAGARTLTVEETLLEPPVLPPPPTRHALLAILVALAALLQVGTIGSGDLYSETEGQYAGAAREMVESHQWLLPTNDGVPRLQKPPLLYWLIIISLQLCGIKAAAA